MLKGEIYWRDSDGLPRILSRVPSGEMNQAEQLQKNLYRKKRGALCSLSPQNFIGSLLAQIHHEEIFDAYNRRGTPVPRSLLPPVEFVKNPVKLFVWDAVNSKSSDVSDKFSAKSRSNLLVKHACGEHAAVILKGPLAGLILSIPNNGSQNKYTISRAFNDYMINEEDIVDIEGGDCKPYPVNINERGFYEADKICLAIIDREFERLAKNYPWAAGAFFKLLSDLDIPCDPGAFHTSRTV